MSRTCSRRQRRKVARYCAKRGVSPHTLALLVAVQLWEVPPTVIQEPGGPIPVQEALPGFAPTIVKIAKPGAEYVWNTVSDWVTSGWDDVIGGFASAASITFDVVRTMIDANQKIAQQAWSSMINHVQAFAATGLIDVWGLANTIEDYFLNFTNFLSDEIAWALAEIAGIDGMVNAKIWDAVQGIDATIQNVADFVVGGVEAWAIDNIYNPLLGDIEGIIGSIDGIAQGVFDRSIAGIDAIVGELGALLNAEALTRAAEIAGVITALGALEQWMTDCGDPLCAQFGPNSPFSKLWKALQDALGILAGISLANLTEKDLERIAQTFAAITTGSADQFFASFVEGGATLGGAAGGLVGEVGQVGSEVLAVLGVPGF